MQTPCMHYYILRNSNPIPPCLLPYLFPLHTDQIILFKTSCTWCSSLQANHVFASSFEYIMVHVLFHHCLLLDEHNTSPLSMIFKDLSSMPVILCNILARIKGLTFQPCMDEHNGFWQCCGKQKASQRKKVGLGLLRT